MKTTRTQNLIVAALAGALAVTIAEEDKSPDVSETAAGWTRPASSLPGRR